MSISADRNKSFSAYKAAVEHNTEAEFLIVAQAEYLQQQHICVGRRSPNTYLAENRLSNDFCDWSEVTDGLLWEAWRQRGKNKGRRDIEKQIGDNQISVFNTQTHPMR